MYDVIAAARARISENRRWWVLAAACMGVLIAIIDVTIVNVALPTIQRQLHARFSALQWIINVYNLALAVALPLAGRIGDIYGRRRLFAAGLVIFGTGSALAGLSGELHFGFSHIAALIGARAFQAVGGGALLPVSLAILSDAFDEERERGLAMGLRGAMAGLGLALGPITGGLLIRFLSWPWIFYVNVPICAVALALTYLAVKESRDPNASRAVDWPGAATAAGGTFLLVWALIRIEDAAHASVLQLAWPFAAGIALLASFVVLELRAREPLIDLRMFVNSSFTAANVVVFTLAAGLITTMFFLTLYLQEILRFSPLQTGIRLLPMTFLVAAVAPVAGRSMSKISPRWLVGAGMLLTAAGVYLFRLVTPATTPPQWIVIVPAMVTLGLGMGLANAPILNVAVSTVERGKAGVASGMAGLSRRIGGAFGVAVFGLLLVQHAGGGAGLQGGVHNRVAWIDGFRWTVQWAALLVAGGAVCAFLLISRSDLRGKNRNMKDITQHILDDHEELRRGFAEVDEATAMQEREQTWDHLARLLEIHASAEEEIFYPALLDEGTQGGKETKDAINDHNEIRDAVRRASRAKAGSEEWRRAVADARNKNSQHMAEEERGALADFRRNAPEERRSRLGERWAAFKRDRKDARGIDDSNTSPERYVSQHR